MSFFDITRLCKRASYSGPSGIDRVDLAYLQHLRAVGTVEYIVNGLAGFSVIDHRLGEAFADKLVAVWRGEQEGFTHQQLAPFCDNSQRVRIAGKWQARRRGLNNLQSVKSFHELCESDLAALELLDPSAHGKAYRVDKQWRSKAKAGCFFGVSHSICTRTAFLAELARHSKLKRVLFIHDTIPCDFPEYCREHEGLKHLLRLRNALRYASHIVVNSEYTACRLDHWRQVMGAPEHPVAVIPIGVEPSVLEQARVVPVPVERPYFVVLGTIEPRKNHALLVHLWREFTETLAPGDIPELLIVGRRGWDNESLFRILDRCEVLRGHVSEMNNVPDAQLWPLLRNARAMLFPSFVEGWGMPMVEALAMGVPVIGSNIPPFQEAGQGVPELLSPLDGNGWRTAILNYAQEFSHTRTAQLERLKIYHPPTWSDHFSKLADFLGEPSLVG